MLFVTLLFIVIQCFIALLSPTRFILFSLWVQTIPYTWNWEGDFVYDTPFGHLNVVAVQVFGFGLACLLAIASNLGRSAAQVKYLKWHCAFIGFCFFSLVYASSASYGLRMIAKLLGPFLFLIATLAILKSEEELKKSRSAILGSGVILVLLALYARATGINSDPNVISTGISGLGPPSMGPPVFSAHMLPVAMLALAICLDKPRPVKIAFVVVCAASILAALQRTSAAALYLGFSIILFVGMRGVWRVLLPALGIAGLPALLVFNPVFRQRMFFDDTSSEKILADPSAALSTLNTSGRSTLWSNMLSRFFEPHPVTGSGIGSTQEYFYTHTGGGVVHSEYVRLLCEVGFIGLALFVVTLLSYLWRLRKYAATPNAKSLRLSALAAIGGVVTYGVFCLTDNAFDYVSQFGVYVFGLVAIAIKSNELSSIQLREAAEPTVFEAGRQFPNLMR